MISSVTVEIAASKLIFSSITLELMSESPVALEEVDPCTPELCFHAFDELYCTLTRNKRVPPKFPNTKYPLFVTWNTRSSHPGRAPRLRGCIGSFEGLPLRTGVPEYAIISAFNDERFNKIQESELKSLECVISLLTDFEDAASYLDWTVGVHGISITFPHPSTLSNSSTAPSPLSSSYYLPKVTSRQPFRACYLPDVIPDQGWTKTEAVDSAIAKAGWNGVITEDIRRSVKLRRYQSRVTEAGWDEYVEWRQGNSFEIQS